MEEGHQTLFNSVCPLQYSRSFCLLENQFRAKNTYTDIPRLRHGCLKIDIWFQVVGSIGWLELESHEDRSFLPDTLTFIGELGEGETPQT